MVLSHHLAIDDKDCAPSPRAGVAFGRAIGEHTGLRSFVKGGHHLGDR
jgi:hypothetical protein